MQVESPASTRFLPQRAASTHEATFTPAPGVGAGKRPGRSPDVADRAVPAAAAPVRKGLRGWDPGSQLQLASAQQTRDFLQDMEGGLRALGAAIRGTLAGSPPGDATPDAMLRTLTARWAERGDATAYSLDGQLKFGARGQARQSFRIPGLDVDSLQAQGRETLFFSVTGSGRQPIAVVLDPSCPSRVQVQQMDTALFSAGMRVTGSAQGDLLFDVPEVRWEAVRDTLAIRGGGMRYPAGQMHLVRPQAVAPIVSPDQWRLDDLAGTLRYAAAAQARVRQARQQVDRALVNAAAGPAAAASGETASADWADAFCQEFHERAADPDYGFVASIAPALTGISRERVVSLLSLRAD